MVRVGKRGGRRVSWLVAGLMLLGVLSLHRMARPPRPPDVTAPLRDTVLVLRTAAEACRAELDEGAAGFETFDTRLDSLNERIRELEAMDPRGVPADSYRVYLEAFDQYNDSIPGWSARADTLRARWARCTEVTRSYNALADSLRRLMTRLES